jgi:hypothetical protein
VSKRRPPVKVPKFWEPKRGRQFVVKSYSPVGTAVRPRAITASWKSLAHCCLNAVVVENWTLWGVTAVNGLLAGNTC